MADIKELKDEDLDKVTGGTDEGYNQCRRCISEMFNDVLVNNYTKEGLYDCKNKALGAAMAYYGLGLLTNSEYEDTCNEIEASYNLYLNQFI